jgi:hypothetical protein
MNKHEERNILFIVQAILKARTEIIVYFLLSSWLESLGRDARARRTIPSDARKLPINGARDLERRLSLVRGQFERQPQSAARELRMLEEAAATLSVASEQIRELWRDSPGDANASPVVSGPSVQRRATDRPLEYTPADSSQP